MKVNTDVMKAKANWMTAINYMQYTSGLIIKRKIGNHPVIVTETLAIWVAVNLVSRKTTGKSS